MEWDPHPLGPSKAFIRVFRCIWVMKLWSIWGSQLVFPEIVFNTPTPPHSNQGTNPSHSSSYHVGETLDWQIVLFKVDNTAVVEAINATFCKDLHLMHLIQLLVFFAAYHNFWFHAVHIAGRDNKLADALSRNNISFFSSQVPQPLPQPSTVPPPLIALVTQNLT